MTGVISGAEQPTLVTWRVLLVEQNSLPL